MRQEGELEAEDRSLDRRVQRGEHHVGARRDGLPTLHEQREHDVLDAVRRDRTLHGLVPRALAQTGRVEQREHHEPLALLALQGLRVTPEAARRRRDDRIQRLREHRGRRTQPALVEVRREPDRLAHQRFERARPDEAEEPGLHGHAELDRVEETRCRGVHGQAIEQARCGLDPPALARIQWRPIAQHGTDSSGAPEASSAPRASSRTSSASSGVSARAAAPRPTT